MEQNTIHTVNVESPKSSKWVKGSVIAAIVIVINLFFNYAISLVYQEPTYDQFIKTAQVVEEISTKEKCLEVGGQWNANMYPSQKDEVLQRTGYCDPNFTNQKNYEAARKIYDRNVFVTLVVLGVVILILGAFVKIGVLSLAFSWGGVLSLIIASMRYWSSADKLVRVLILGVALGALIWLAVKKFNK
jgi:hypothetical protein